MKDSRAMKTLVLLVLGVGLSATSVLAQGAQGVLIKQRAKEVVNQSDVRQGVPPPTQPAQPAQAGAVTANPKQKNIALLQADLASLQGKAEVSSSLKQRFAKNLLAAVQGPTKPSTATVTTFVENLAAMVAANPLEAADRTRLAQDLNAAFDCAQLPKESVDKILSDVQAILQVNGVRRQDALSIVNDLRSVAAEIQKAPTR